MYAYIQSKTAVDDGRGGEVVTWSNTPTSLQAMSISPITARQSMEYKTIEVDATHIVKIRGAVAINDQMQILFGSRIFEVVFVEDIQERGILKIVTCRERRS
jgi:SPP1 family predicted phage head-tail adaptor